MNASGEDTRNRGGKRSAMEHIDEQDLDLFAIDHGLLDAPKGMVIQHHLQECGGCKAISETARDIYEALENSREAPHAVVDLLVQQIVPAPKILRLKSQNPRGELVDRPMPLAGVLDQTSDRFVTIANLVGEFGIGSVTLQRNPTSNFFRVQFETRSFLLPRWGVFSLGRTTQVLLDESGWAEFTLSGAEIDHDWVPGEATVRFPAGTVRIELTGLTTGRSTKIRDTRGGIVVEFRRIDNGWRMEIGTLGGAQKFDLVSVINSAGDAEFCPLHERSCRIPESKILDEATLNVYREAPEGSGDLNGGNQPENSNQGTVDTGQ